MNNKNIVNTKKISFSDIKLFLALSFPMILSSGVEAILIFIDRLFLSNYRAGEGKEYLNASIIGGAGVFVLIVFFLVCAEYTNTLVSQYTGAKQREKCHIVVSQAVLFSFMVYPLILLCGFFLPKVFVLFNHNPLQLRLETTYFRILLIGSIFSLLRIGVGGFFIGIHRTKFVLFTSVCTALFNIPLNYILIFGKWGGPELGIMGAAIATVVSEVIGLCIFLAVYWGKKTNTLFSTRRPFLFEKPMFLKLMKYSTPVGVEATFGEGVVMFFLLAMSIYGSTVGASVSVVLNWYVLFFIPMGGIELTTSILVGKHMGARDVDAAKKVVKVSLLLSLSYVGVIIFLVLGSPHIFVSMFVSKMGEVEEVTRLSLQMFKYLSIYLLFDAIHVTFYGALYGAGDTLITTVIFVSIELVFVILLILLVMPQLVGAMGAWMIFTGFAVSFGIALSIRYYFGSWEKIQMV